MTEQKPDGAAPVPCCQKFETCRQMCNPRADYWQGQCEQLRRAAVSAPQEPLVPDELVPERISKDWIEGYAAGKAVMRAHLAAAPQEPQEHSSADRVWVPCAICGLRVPESTAAARAPAVAQTVAPIPDAPPGLDQFTRYFEANYPKGDYIADPSWHAVRLYRAALRAHRDAAPPQPPAQPAEGIRIATQRLREEYRPALQAAWDQIEKLRAGLEAAKAKIDALMLEWCPSEMTPEQIANWEKHQRPVSPQLQAAIDAAISKERAK